MRRMLSDENLKGVVKSTSNLCASIANMDIGNGIEGLKQREIVEVESYPDYNDPHLYEQCVKGSCDIHFNAKTKSFIYDWSDFSLMGDTEHGHFDVNIVLQQDNYLSKGLKGTLCSTIGYRLPEQPSEYNIAFGPVCEYLVGDIPWFDISGKIANFNFYGSFNKNSYIFPFDEVESENGLDFSKNMGYVAYFRDDGVGSWDIKPFTIGQNLDDEAIPGSSIDGTGHNCSFYYNKTKYRGAKLFIGWTSEKEVLAFINRWSDKGVNNALGQMTHSIY